MNHIYNCRMLLDNYCVSYEYSRVLDAYYYILYCTECVVDQFENHQVIWIFIPNKQTDYYQTTQNINWRNNYDT